MKQYREGLGSSITRKPHHFNLRPPAFRNISYRDANLSKGDKLRVELMCYRCRNPQSYFIDQYPRYEIASGKYLTWITRWCYYCLSGPVRFIPVDKSLPRKSFGAVQYQHRKEKAKNSPALTTRADLSEMTKLEVLAWLASQGFRGDIVNWSRKHELVALAEGVWDYLTGPQDQEAKLRLQEILNDRQTYHLRPWTPVQCLSRASFTTLSWPFFVAQRSGVWPRPSLVFGPISFGENSSFTLP
jgi:hypothetical protein